MNAHRYQQHLLREGKGEAREGGMVTAEAALAMTSLTAIFLLMLALLSGVVTYLHAQDLSRAAARSLSLGVSEYEVAMQVHAREPKASLSVEAAGSDVAATVAVKPARVLEGLGLHIEASTVAVIEPGSRR